MSLEDIMSDIADNIDDTTNEYHGGGRPNQRGYDALMLTETQARLVEEYFRHVNLVAASDRAGMSESEARAVMAEPLVSNIVSTAWALILDHVSVHGLSIHDPAYAGGDTGMEQ